MQFKTFIETQIDGYWYETNIDTGFLASYCANYDGYITEEFYIGLSNIRDGYFSNFFKRSMPTNLSNTVKYKLGMLASLDNVSTYYLTLNEINEFDWSKQIYGSSMTVSTTFYDVAPNFLLYYLTELNSLGSPDQVRMIILKKG